MSEAPEPAIWFPTVRTRTGTDVFTERLAEGLRQRGLRAEVTWLPLRAEYAPWTVQAPKPPAWANVVHVNTWLHTRFIPKQLPVVATIHHAIHHPDARAYKGVARSAYHHWWIAPNERRVLHRAQEVIAVSEYVADTTRRTLSDVSMQVIYNGVNTDTFRPGTRQRQFGEPFKLLFVGSWMARKGVDMLAPILRGLGDGFVLYYTGGPSAERHKSQMPENMVDIGRLPDDAAVVANMQGADALLFPSRSEGHPLVAIEAMACGLPVIGMKGSSVGEAVLEGETGLMCPRGDIIAFITAVRQLAADPAYYAALAETARAYAVEQFSLGTMVDAHIQLFRRVIRPL